MRSFSNYRNTPAIVDFCNNRFHGNMKWYGKISEDQKPIIISDVRELRTAVNARDKVIIVKNRRTFKKMCVDLNMDEELFYYLDTNVDSEISGKIHCYSVFAAKGLEFSKVLVYADEMNENQKTVACTRAMESLQYFE